MQASDFKEVLRCLNDCGAKYLVVGAYAVMRFTEPRATKDLDIWIDNSPENTRRVFRALVQFGAPLAGIVSADLEKPGMVLQIGVAPIRVDFLTSLPGLRFQKAWENHDIVLWEGVQAHFISKPDLIRAKQSAGRRSDRQDLRRLKGKK